VLVNESSGQTQSRCLASLVATKASRALSRFPRSPYFVYQNGQLVLDDSFSKLIVETNWTRLRVFLSRHSRLVEVARR
jgi:hypothetical protein